LDVLLYDLTSTYIDDEGIPEASTATAGITVSTVGRW
jgi:hypothetical protein